MLVSLSLTNNWKAITLIKTRLTLSTPFHRAGTNITAQTSLQLVLNLQAQRSSH